MLISTLINKATTELHKMDYSPRVIEYTIATWRCFSEFCADKEATKYSTALRDEFLHSYDAQNLKRATIGRKSAAMAHLESFVRNGSWEKGLQIQRDPLPENFTAFLIAQDASLVKKSYSEISRETVHKFCCGFMRFLVNEGVNSLSNLTQSHISKYLLTLNGHAKSTVRGELSRLRQMLKSMYLLEYTTEDFRSIVPSYHFGQSDSISKIWESEEIEQVLDVVDKSNPKGKRDMAFMMIAAELGVRSADIRNLKLSDIDWGQCKVTFIQSKTGKFNVLPIGEKLGEAIIDYLRVRPKTDSPYLFVKLIPPYGQMAKFNTAFMKYVERAGIKVERHAHHGLHSLRATVATRLLNADVSPDVIVPFLGHSNNQSLHSYIRLDIENLRECALSFENGALI